MKQSSENYNSDIKRKLNLFDISIYQDIIPERILRRGEPCYLNNKIKLISNKENKYIFKAYGTEEYDALIKFNKKDNDKIDSAKCSCPYYLKEEKYCKHIAGALYSIKCSDNYNKIKKEIEVALKETKKVKQEFEIVLKEKKNKVNKYEYYKEQYDDLVRKYEDFKKATNGAKTEYSLINILRNIKEDTKFYKQKCNELKNKKNVSIFLKILKVIIAIVIAVIGFVIKAIIILFSIIIGANNDKKHSYNKTFSFKPKRKKRSYTLYDELEPW